MLVTLLDECIAALGENVIISSAKENKDITECLEKNFPIEYWSSRIDWKRVKKSKQVFDTYEIANALYIEDYKEYLVYVIWDAGNYPVLLSDMATVLANFNDILSVSFDTWLFNPEEGYIVECHHSGEWMVGWTEK